FGVQGKAPDPSLDRPPGDVHTFTRPQAVACLPALVHTPEVNQSEGTGPPHWGAISVSLEGRSSRSGLLLFHRAIRSLHAALFPGTKIPGYAHFTQSMWIIAATSSVSANGLQFCPVDSPANRAQSFPSQEHRVSEVVALKVTAD